MTTTRGTVIRWLDDPESTNSSIVGGKAANLAALAGRYPVPPGFSVTASAFEGLDPDSIDPEAALQGVRLPAVLHQEVEEAYRALGERIGTPEPNVAVRSSGLDEDGVENAFPGQFETYLNVSGLDRVCGAVLACWASGWSERVQAYRQNHGLAAGDGVSVLVQDLVPADSAAVAFSANPITHNRGEVMINASYGLGESIVGGTVTPDTYVVRKTDLEVAEIRVAKKQRMTVRVPGGIREVNVPRFIQEAQVLNREQIASIARMAAELEVAMGWPVDIECACSKGKVYLLQCRPITTLQST